MFFLPNERYEVEARIMVNICECLDTFEKDIEKPFENLSQNMKDIYKEVCDIVGLKHTKLDIELVRQCVFNLRAYPNVMTKWKQLRRRMDTIQDSSAISGNKRRSTVFLVPPVSSCVHCNHNLSLKHRKESVALTRNGPIRVIHLSYCCRKCGNNAKEPQYHYNYYTNPSGECVHYTGDYSTRQHKSVYSQYLENMCGFLIT
eukprot:781126_1